jgi:hypothetical protein
VRLLSLVTHVNEWDAASSLRTGASRCSRGALAKQVAARPRESILITLMGMEFPETARKG